MDAEDLVSIGCFSIYSIGVTLMRTVSWSWLKRNSKFRELKK